MKVSNQLCSMIRKQIFLAFHQTLRKPPSTAGLNIGNLSTIRAGQQSSGSFDSSSAAVTYQFGSIRAHIQHALQ